MWHVGVFLQNYGCFLFSVFAIWVVAVLGCWVVLISVNVYFFSSFFFFLSFFKINSDWSFIFACRLVCRLEDICFVGNE
jgi:hypothetical protein